jgi:hypothetical protein
MWFLHGALHVFDSGTEIQKYTWKNTGVRLIDQIRDALSRDYFPLFVSEGTSDEKYEKIRHNDYLAKGYRSFSQITGDLFIYGHSLAAWRFLMQTPRTFGASATGLLLSLSDGRTLAGLMHPGRRLGLDQVKRAGQFGKDALQLLRTMAASTLIG